VGGSDQWGNIIAGTDLIRRMLEGDDPSAAGHQDGQGGAAGEAGSTQAHGMEQCYGLTFPLLLKADGSKFGKSESGAVSEHAPARRPPVCVFGAEPRHTTCLPGTGAGWLAACSKDQAKASSVARSRLPEDCRRRPPCVSPPAWPIPTSPTLALVPLPAPQLWLSPSMLSPYKFYQAIFQTADVDVARMLRALTALPLEEIEAVEAAMREAGYEANSAQRLLAEEVTRMVHGDQGLDQALKATQARAPCFWVCGRRVVWGRVGAAAGVLQALAAGRE
jgi:hypothetical protein